MVEQDVAGLGMRGTRGSSLLRYHCIPCYSVNVTVAPTACYSPAVRSLKVLVSLLTIRKMDLVHHDGLGRDETEVRAIEITSNNNESRMQYEQYVPDNRMTKRMQGRNVPYRKFNL